MRPRRALAATAVAVALAGGAVTAGESGGEAAPPPDGAARFVPLSARAYMNVAVRSPAMPRAARLRRELPALDLVATTVLGRIAAGAGVPDPESLVAEFEPWLGREAALALLGSGRDWLLLLEARDPRAARRSLDALLDGRGGAPRFAVAGGFALVGTGAAVRRALEVHAGRARPLASDADYTALRDGLPRDRVATAYLSGAGLRRWLPTPAAALAAVSGASELRAAAAAMSLDGERGRISLRAVPVGRSECAGTSARESLLDSAPASTAGYLELARPDCVARALLASRTDAGRALRALAGAARSAGLGLERDVLPLVEDGAALALTGDDATPSALTLIAGGVRGRRALDVLGALQPALARLLAPVRRGQAPAFETRQLGDVRALTAELAPGLALSYTVFRRRLLLSTAPEGLAAVAGAPGLGDAPELRRRLGEPPRDTSALLFLDLDQLLALAERAGLAESPAYLVVRDDLQKLESVGAVIGREGTSTTAELSFQNP